MSQSTPEICYHGHTNIPVVLLLSLRKVPGYHSIYSKAITSNHYRRVGESERVGVWMGGDLQGKVGVWMGEGVEGMVGGRVGV